MGIEEEIYKSYNPKKAKKDRIEDDNYSSVRVYCKKCGHTNIIPAYIDKKECTWCHSKVLNDTKVHFKRKLKQMMEEKNGK